MTALHDDVPLGNYRAVLEQYLRRIGFPAGSVAASIIEERRSSLQTRHSLRPELVLWGCNARGSTIEDAFPVAAAFDLFDHFLLLHDEIADGTGPTVRRWGLGQSLNAGDALCALAFRTLASDVYDAPRRLCAARLVGRAVLEAIDSAPAPGRYAALTGAALAGGVRIAGAPDAAVDAFHRAGQIAQSDPQAAVSLLHPYVADQSRDHFEEAVRYIARRAAS